MNIVITQKEAQQIHAMSKLLEDIEKRLDNMRYNDNSELKDYQLGRTVASVEAANAALFSAMVNITVRAECENADHLTDNWSDSTLTFA